MPVWPARAMRAKVYGRPSRSHPSLVLTFLSFSRCTLLSRKAPTALQGHRRRAGAYGFLSLVDADRCVRSRPLPTRPFPFLQALECFIPCYEYSALHHIFLRPALPLPFGWAYAFFALSAAATSRRSISIASPGHFAPLLTQTPRFSASSTHAFAGSWPPYAPKPLPESQSLVVSQRLCAHDVDPVLAA